LPFAIFLTPEKEHCQSVGFAFPRESENPGDWQPREIHEKTAAQAEARAGLIRGVGAAAQVQPQAIIFRER
jgi:hypothetical protein